MKRIVRFWPLILAPLLLYTPLFVNPSLFLNRGNDLQEFFWPAMYFVKNQIIQNHTLPLWNPMYLSGYPLIADPQAPLFYLPNIIILILPIDTGIILSILLHTIFASIFFYILASKGFSLDHRSSVFASLIYILIPRLSAYLEAGHLGLIFAHTWIPLAVYSAIKISRDRSMKFAVYYAVALAMLFFTHTITFLVVSASAVCLIFLSFAFNPKRGRLASLIVRTILANFIAFGFTAIALLPQIAWSGLSTRQLLLNHPETYPLWNSKIEFIKAALASWTLESFDTEKIITLGVLPTVLSCLAFLKLSHKLKIVLVGVGVFILIIALNNSSPIYQMLISQKWFVLMRVTTRVWIIPTVIVCLLSAFAISKIKSKLIVYLLMTLTLAELFFLSWKVQAKQPPIISNIAPQQVIDFIKNDPDQFRVFCTSGCISQKTAVINDIELVEGYNTLQQMNYYQYAWQYSGEWWDYYTLAIPPFGIRHQKLENLDTNALGLLNTKYVISPYEINNSKMRLVHKSNGYLVYLNEEYLPRAFTWPEKQQVQILDYKPNQITLDTSNLQPGSQIVLSEVYSPGWHANGKIIDEGPAIFRSFQTGNVNQRISVEYTPPLSGIGKTITGLTLVPCLFLLILKDKHKHRSQ